MKTTFWGLLCFFCVAGQLLADEAPELNGLRKSYEDAIARSTRPVTQTYMKELENLRDSYTRSAKLAAANEVQAEIDVLNQKLTAMDRGAPVTVHEFVVLIPGRSPNGYKLGPVISGDVITLSYVSGKWKDHGVLATENPDAGKADDGSRLVIATAAAGNKPGTVLKVVPSGTAKAPFSYRMPTTVDNVVLRIHNNSDNNANPGSVRYKVTIAH